MTDQDARTDGGVLKPTSGSCTPLAHPAKLLSVVGAGINDDYLGNYRYRLTTCLNHLAHHLRALGRLDQVEVLMTDWGSPSPLSGALALSPEAAQVCRFVYVPPEVAHTVRPDGKFAGAPAINAGLRRATGEHVMLLETDSLFTRCGLRVLLDILSGETPAPFEVDRTFIFIGRREIPWHLVRRSPTVEEWDTHLTLLAGNWATAPGAFPGLGISGSAHLMHRALWHACRGYNEGLLGVKWTDSDLVLRVTQRYHWVDLASLGVTVYHMTHWPPGSRRTRPDGDVNPNLIPASFAANSSDWGLGAWQLEVQEPKSPGSTGEAPAASQLTRVPGELGRHLRAIATNDAALDVWWRVSYGMRVDRVDWELFCALAWHSQESHPCWYLEFGISHAAAAAAIAGLCPGITLYGIEPGGTGVDSPLNPLQRALERVAFSGHARFLGGDPESAVPRLVESTPIPLALDAAVVRGQRLGLDPRRTLADLSSSLAPDALLAVVTESPGALDEWWTCLCGLDAATLCARFRSDRVALALVKGPGGLSAQPNASCALYQEVDVGRPLRQFTGLSRAWRGLRQPRRYPEFASRLAGKLLHSQ